MQKYADYTPAPAAWLDELPSHWQCTKIGALFSERKSKVSDKDYAPLSVARIGVVPQLATAVKTDAGDNRKLVCAGDFVINSRSDRKGSCGVAKLDGSVSLINIVLTPRNGLSERYVHYLLRSQPFSEEYYRNGRGIVADLWTTRYSELKSILLPVPPREEQDQIVRFLDWKVSSINKLINIKKKEIKAIDALKRSIISHVITHGLMPDVPMKYSGVKWLGDIPAHWQTIKLKRVTKVRNEKGIYTPNSEDKYIGLENIKGYSNNISITSSEHDVSVQCICHSGDLMFSKLRPYLAKTVIVPYNCFCTGEMMVISAFNGDMRFLRYVMLHERFIDSVNSSTYGAKMPRANSSYILNMQVPIPQVDEQQKIADYIDEKVLQIDMATKKYKQIIDDLQVLKTRLISDTVTGKIDVRGDVRGIEIPEYEFVDEDADADNEYDSEEDTEEQEGAEE